MTLLGVMAPDYPQQFLRVLPITDRVGAEVNRNSSVSSRFS